MANSTWKQALLLLVVVAVGYLPSPSHGHGRLMDPPSRSSLWREDSSSPANYEDNELNCGGFANQWEGHGGKCGICGDPWQGPRDNEAGGPYANGIISRNYIEGQVIEVKVEITAHHKGYFEFRICPNNDDTSPASKDCLDQHLLPLANQPGVTRYQLPEGPTVGWYILMVQLPQDLTCEQCVFQWHYNAGNSYGCDDESGTCGIGYGAQEQFRGCADVSITDNGLPPTTTTTSAATTTTTTSPTATTTTTSPTTTTTSYTTTLTTPTTTTTTTTAPTTATTQNSGGSGTCHSAGAYAGSPAIDAWCLTNCAVGYCPASHCACD